MSHFNCYAVCVNYADCMNVECHHVECCYVQCCLGNLFNLILYLQARLGAYLGTIIVALHGYFCKNIKLGCKCKCMDLPTLSITTPHLMLTIAMLIVLHANCRILYCYAECHLH